MRIAIVSDVIYEYISGLAIFTKRFIDQLKKHVEKVIVITAGTTQKCIEIDNVKIYYLKGLSLKKFDFHIGVHPLLSIKKIFREEKTDIVHCMSPLPMAVASVFHAKKINIPVIFTSHLQMENIMKNMNITSAGILKLIAFYGVWLYNACDRITCPSNYAKKELIYYGIKNLSRLSIISNGINADHFKPADCRQEKMVLFVGRLMPEKCIDTLILASAIVNREYPDYKFVIAGSGYAMPELKDLADKINPGIRFTGRIPDTELLDLLQKCEIFVLPSESELQGICLLEAMSCQKPTIASDSPTSAAVELANILFKHKDHDDLAKKIIYLIENKNIAKQIAKKNREIILREHDYSKITDKYIELYKDAIKLKSGNNHENEE
ncbi:MAG: glycosyltransferase [Spirochaetales bacterium]|nr:glycosyltransferase [Spirochaetales bacterium]